MTWILIVILLLLILFFFLTLNSYRVRTNLLYLSFNDLPSGFDGTKIFFISDIHRRNLSDKHLQDAKNKAGKIDFTLIGGDLIESGVPLERARSNLRKLKKLGAPVYFVWGNHDEKVDTRQLSDIFHQEGIKVLNNEAVRFETLAGEVLWLLGVQDICSKRDRLDLALMDTEEVDGFRILLCHVPTIVRKIIPEHKISLVLSGHTHGGQISLPLIGPITAAVGKLFPKEYSGLYELEQTKLFISNGYGTVRVPFRLWARPEVVVIELKQKMDNKALHH